MSLSCPPAATEPRGMWRQGLVWNGPLCLLGGCEHLSDGPSITSLPSLDFGGSSVSLSSISGPATQQGWGTDKKPLLKAEGCCFPSLPTSLLLTDRAHPAERLEEAALLLEQIEVISQISAAQRGKLAHLLCTASDSLHNNSRKSGFFFPSSTSAGK